MRALEGFEEEEDEVKEEETANGVKTHLALCLVSKTFDVGLASAIVTVAVAAAAMAMATKSILRPKKTQINPATKTPKSILFQNGTRPISLTFCIGRWGDEAAAPFTVWGLI